jgi:CubicO group peptidase (beta-lactamase class C family)
MSLLKGSGVRPFTAANWGYPPHNRASFQQVQQLVPTVRLSRGPDPFIPLVQKLQNVAEISYVGLDGNTRSIQQMLDGTYTDAFVVTKNGTTVAEDYRNGMGADSHHLINSVSKSYLGMLVGILVAEGILDPVEALTTYIPEFADTAFRKTTIQQALDMTAAVKYGEDYADRRADFWRETAVVGWRPELVDEHLPKTLFDYACSLRDVEQVDGEHFHYRTVLTNVIAMTLERATNQSAAKLMEQKIWQPLGPEQDAVVVVDSSGLPYFGAGMNVCARDLARFGQMLAQNGYYNGRQIVPSAWVEDSMLGNDEVKSLFAAGDYADMIPGGHYRNQIWADSTRGLLVCIGIHGQTIYVNQSTGVVVVKLSTHPESAELALFADTFAGMQAITEAV